METLTKYCDATCICIALIIALIIILIIVSRKINVQITQTQGQTTPAKKKNWCVIIVTRVTIAALIICCVDKVFKLDLYHKIIQSRASFVNKGDSPRNVNPASSATRNYDTDPRNDQYIKGAMTAEQLILLDEILTFEKRNSGKQLGTPQLKAFSKNDPEVQAAYYRWRWCKDLMRSHEQVIYPDERK